MDLQIATATGAPKSHGSREFPARFGAVRRNRTSHHLLRRRARPEIRSASTAIGPCDKRQRPSFSAPPTNARSGSDRTQTHRRGRQRTERYARVRRRLCTNELRPLPLATPPNWHRDQGATSYPSGLPCSLCCVAARRATSTTTSALLVPDRPWLRRRSPDPCLSCSLLSSLPALRGARR